MESKNLVEPPRNQDYSKLLKGLDYLMGLSLNSSAFLQFPYEILRTLCKCEQTFRKVVSNLLA
jgi:hypothetical protein